METLKEDYSLKEEGGSTDPGTSDPTNPGSNETTGNKYHTEILPDSSLEIDIKGFTTKKTVYSVDIEWDAITFEYEKSS